MRCKQTKSVKGRCNRERHTLGAMGKQSEGASDTGREGEKVTRIHNVGELDRQIARNVQMGTERWIGCDTETEQKRDIDTEKPGVIGGDPTEGKGPVEFEGERYDRNRKPKYEPRPTSSKPQHHQPHQTRYK